MGMKQKMHHERVHRNDTVWSRVFDVFNVIVLIFVAFITIAPFLYVIACSFATEKEIKEKVFEALKTVGMDSYAKKMIGLLSGGQQQRTSIGRAIVKNPDLLLCDEPTGALDYKTSKEILKLIEDVNKKYGNTVVLVTHNDAIKNMADRVIKLRDGQIRHDIVNTEKTPAQELDW